MKIKQTILGTDEEYDEYVKDENPDTKEFDLSEKMKEEISKGCGDEYIDEETEFEFMCGKHIWKSKGIISELRLCEWCQHLYDFANKLAGNELK